MILRKVYALSNLFRENRERIKKNPKAMPVKTVMKWIRFYELNLLQGKDIAL